jgi:hypothetical protein
MSKTLYLAPFYRSWEDFKLESPLGVETKFKAPPGNPGVVLVFESMASMLEVYPDADEDRVMVFALPEKEKA